MLLSQKAVLHQVFLYVSPVDLPAKFDSSLFSYLIDFESSIYDPEIKPTTWPALGKHLADSNDLLEQWRLEFWELRQ